MCPYRHPAWNHLRLTPRAGPFDKQCCVKPHYRVHLGRPCAGATESRRFWDTGRALRPTVSCPHRRTRLRLCPWTSLIPIGRGLSFSGMMLGSTGVSSWPCARPNLPFSWDPDCSIRSQPPHWRHSAPVILARRNHRTLEHAPLGWPHLASRVDSRELRAKIITIQRPSRRASKPDSNGSIFVAAQVVRRQDSESRLKYARIGQRSAKRTVHIFLTHTGFDPWHRVFHLAKCSTNSPASR